jgi:hypothetical protein
MQIHLLAPNIFFFGANIFMNEKEKLMINTAGFSVFSSFVAYGTTNTYVKCTMNLRCIVTTYYTVGYAILPPSFFFIAILIELILRENITAVGVPPPPDRRCQILSKQANEQTCERAKKQISEQANKHTSLQAN